MKPAFIYFENTEGGMETHEGITGPEYFDTYPPRLYGWMTECCRREDTELLRWMHMAEVGDVAHHRLGVLVAVKPVSA